jgi:hypothetical protein
MSEEFSLRDFAIWILKFRCRTPLLPRAAARPLGHGSGPSSEM